MIASENCMQAAYLFLNWLLKWTVIIILYFKLEIKSGTCFSRQALHVKILHKVNGDFSQLICDSYSMVMLNRLTDSTEKLIKLTPPPLQKKKQIFYFETAGYFPNSLQQLKIIYRCVVLKQCYCFYNINNTSQIWRVLRNSTTNVSPGSWRLISPTTSPSWPRSSRRTVTLAQTEAWSAAQWCHRYRPSSLRVLSPRKSKWDYR